MAEQPAGERTEQPTPKRLSKAREEGQVPQSQEFMSFVSIVVLVSTVALLASWLMRWCTGQLEAGMSCDRSPLADGEAFIGFVNSKIVSFIVVSGPIFIALSIGAVVGNIAVGGLNYAPRAVKLDLRSLSPSNGMAKMFNVRSMVKLVVSIIKLLFISAVSWYYLQSRMDDIAMLRWAWSGALLAGIARIILGLLIRICIALLVIGVADTAFQKWKYIQDLKMTKQQVKEERRQSEGSPEVKNRIRRLQMAAAMQRMLQEVPKASVVLVNPTHVAVALRYDSEAGDAPVLVAKGADQAAEKIREIARAYGVPIIRRPELARTIFSTVKLNACIPETLYTAVAEVLAMVYRLRQRKR